MLGAMGPNRLTWEPQEQDKARAFRPDCLRVYLDVPESYLAWALQEFAGLELVLRNTGDGVIESPAIECEQIDAHLLRLKAAFPGTKLYFEVRNEPNIEGAYGPDGWAYFYPHLQYIISFMQDRHPDVDLITPGLAVRVNDMEWARRLEDQYRRCRYIGARGYSQYGHHLDPEWGLRVMWLRTIFPDKEFFMTEFGESTPGESSTVKTDRLLEQIVAVDALGYVPHKVVFLPFGGTPYWADYFLSLEDCARFGQRERGEQVVTGIMIEMPDDEVVAFRTWQAGGGDVLAGFRRWLKATTPGSGGNIQDWKDAGASLIQEAYELGRQNPH